MRRKRKYFSLLFNNRNYMGESQVGDKGGELNRWEQATTMPFYFPLYWLLP
jgi:hypothetical protein